MTGFAIEQRAGLQPVHIALEPDPRRQLRLQFRRRRRQLQNIPEAVLQRRQASVERGAGIAHANDRYRRLRSHAADLPAQVDSRAQREPQIEKHGIGSTVGEEPGQRFGAASRRESKAILTQHRRQRLHQRLVGGENGDVGRLSPVHRGKTLRLPPTQPGYSHRSPHPWETFGRHCPPCPQEVSPRRPRRPLVAQDQRWQCVMLEEREANRPPSIKYLLKRV